MCASGLAFVLRSSQIVLHNRGTRRLDGEASRTDGVVGRIGGETLVSGSAAFGDSGAYCERYTSIRSGVTVFTAVVETSSWTPSRSREDRKETSQNVSRGSRQDRRRPETSLGKGARREEVISSLAEFLACLMCGTAVHRQPDSGSAGSNDAIGALKCVSRSDHLACAGEAFAKHGTSFFGPQRIARLLFAPVVEITDRLCSLDACARNRPERGSTVFSGPTIRGRGGRSRPDDIRVFSVARHLSGSRVNDRVTDQT
jgi:hypothetical protein